MRGTFGNFSRTHYRIFNRIGSTKVSTGQDRIVYKSANYVSIERNMLKVYHPFEISAFFALLKLRRKITDLCEFRANI